MNQNFLFFSKILKVKCYLRKNENTIIQKKKEKKKRENDISYTENREKEM